MNRRRAASLLLIGTFALTTSGRSFADDQKKEDAAKDVKFACSQHGPKNMSLTLSLEKGDARKVEFIGGNSAAKWFVKIDGNDTEVANGDTVKVHSGDTITWTVTAGTHGVAFAEQDLAEAMLTFEADAGRPLVDLNDFLKTQDWKDFGTKRWGAKPVRFVNTPILLAKCKVK